MFITSFCLLPGKIVMTAVPFGSTLPSGRILLLMKHSVENGYPTNVASIPYSSLSFFKGQDAEHFTDTVTDFVNS